MKFLKVLINSLISAVLFSSLIAILIYDLNIQMNFLFSTFCQLTLFIIMTYGLFIVIFCIIIFYIIQFFHGKKIQLPIISTSFLMMSFSLLILFFCIIFKANLNFFQSFFNQQTQPLLKNQYLMFLVLGSLGLILFYAYHKLRKNKFILLIYFLCFITVMIFSVQQRTSFPSLHKPGKTAQLEAKEIDKKITIIGLEGLSFDFLIPLINEEKLPNFSWLMEEGSWGKLINFTPNEPIILNSSFNSGKLPSKHRQLSIFKYFLPTLKQEIEVVPRYILFRQFTRINLLLTSLNPIKTDTIDIWKIFKDNNTTYLKRDWPYSRNLQTPSLESEKSFNRFFDELSHDGNPLVNILKQTFYRDFDFEKKVAQERNETQPQLTYFMLNGLNTVEVYFYKYSFPEFFGEISQEDINKYHAVIENYYKFYDQILGKYLTTLKEDELLVIYSPHGIEPLPVWKRIVDWILGNTELSATHDLAPDGVAFFFGKEIARGKNVEGISIIDIAPTLLYYLGLPVGKDMDGIVQSSIFVNSFTAENPVFYISSYEEIEIVKSKE